jgi:heptosyltransferase I
MDLRVVLTGGTKDQEFCEDLGENVINLVGKTSLLEMSAVIEKAEFVIAPDTGPIHIGSGLKRPVIGLYAATDKRLTGPYFHLDLVVDRFFEAFSKMKGKKDLDLVWNQRIREEGAMDLITVEDVIDSLSRITCRSLCGSPSQK